MNWANGETVTVTMSRVVWDMFREYVEMAAESLHAPTVFFRADVGGQALQLDGMVMGVALDEAGGVVLDVSLLDDHDLALPSAAVVSVDWP